MTTDPFSDPADVAERQQEVVPPPLDDEASAPDPDELPLEANEADVAEQRRDVPGWPDDEEPDA